MQPLQSIAMGLVVVALTARVQGYDLLPDPLGWLLVLLGVAALHSLAGRRTLLALAVLAAAVSTIVWFPTSQAFLDDHDAALRWAANLPQLAFLTVLCHRLAQRAGAAGDASAARWLRTALAATLVVAVLPVLVFGGGLLGLEAYSYLAAGVALILVIWLLFAYARRPWATAMA